MTLKIIDYGKTYAGLNEGIFSYKSPTFTLTLPNGPFKVTRYLGGLGGLGGIGLLWSLH